MLPLRAQERKRKPTVKLDKKIMCLETIDNLRKHDLLPSKNAWTETKMKMDDEKLGVQVHDGPVWNLGGVMCETLCKEILQSAHLIGFSDVDHAYDQKERDADRLCVLDENLANRLWERLKPVVKTVLPAMSPFGFVDPRQKWEPTSINPCFRLSRYLAGSNGFTRHHDSQYCHSDSCRSCLSVVLYLNDDFIGGETAFYQTVGATVSGLTLKQELELVQTRECCRVSPKVGCAVMFPHDLLHAGLPVTTGTKYVLRTDLIFTAIDLNPFQRININWEEFDLCCNLFREAQNMELDGNRKKASDLYERALSLRRHQSRALAIDNRRRLERPCLLVRVPDDIWMEMIYSISFQDQAAFKQTCKYARALLQRWDSIYWKRKVQAKITRLPQLQLQTDEQRCLGNEQFIPKFKKRSGEQCVFKFEDQAFFQEFTDGCLRVAAAYTLYQFGLPADAKTFIGRYDPDRQTVLKCPIELFLATAFYQLPCIGQYYHLYETSLEDPNAWATSTLEDEKASKNGNKLGRFYPSLGRFYPSLDKRLSYKNLSPRAAMDAYGPPATDIGAGYVPVDHTIDIEWFDSYCQCGSRETYGDEDTQSGHDKRQYHHSNLIADFSKHDLIVCPLPNDHECKINYPKHGTQFIALLSKRALPRTAFNHASCCCDYEKQIITARHVLAETLPRHILDHIHISFYIKSSSVIVTTTLRTTHAL
jgi:hypothetical protein